MTKHFRRRFEFYYQSVAVYAVALIIYAAIRGTFAESEFRIVFRDPIVYAFIIVLAYSVIILVFNLLYQRDVVLTDNSIVFQNRFDRKEISFSEIEWIRVGKAKRMKVRGSYRVIRLKMKNQMRAVRINPVHFHEERGMMEAFKELSEKLGNPARARKEKETGNV
ncbi:MAG: hypothetical protein M1339_00035 [Bacteroidetes bacterium]|nr:hypothetical protein [Bacteroidota bacterium]